MGAGRRHRIEAALMERMAAEQPACREIAAVEDAVEFHGLGGIDGTGRLESTGRRKVGRDRRFVEAEDSDNRSPYLQILVPRASRLKVIRNSLSRARNSSVSIPR